MNISSLLNIRSLEKIELLFLSYRAYLKAQPALEVALIQIISLILFFKSPYALPLLLILMGSLGFKRAICFVLPLVILFGSYFYLFYQGAPPYGEQVGSAKIHLKKVSFQSGFFGSSWIYSGVVERFQGAKGTYTNLPFTYQRKGKLAPLNTDYDYEVEVLLKRKETYGYSLKLAPEREFRPLKKNWGLARKRYQMKQAFNQFLKKKIKSKGAREFLMGITTGDFSNPFLSFTFSRFGLNHLLAISGFHFGLLLLFCNFILTPIFSKKWKTLLLILFLAGFYFFVGDTPSLSRAWIVSTLYLIAVLIDKRPSPINTLSLALSLILILDPLMIYHLGFQFSFWVTYGILFYSNRIEQWIKKRAFRNFFLKNTLIKAVALGLSVHVAAVPLTLYYFHKFYFLSFIFNFFVPLIVGGTLFIFLSALLIYCFAPFLAHYLFFMVNHVTKWLLDLIYWVPTSFDYCMRVAVFPLSLLFCYLILFVFYATLKSDSLLEPLDLFKQEQREQKKLTFIEKES